VVNSKPRIIPGLIAQNSPKQSPFWHFFEEQFSSFSHPKFSQTAQNLDASANLLNFALISCYTFFKSLIGSQNLAFTSLP
jgi:hypothetical protein